MYVGELIIWASTSRINQTRLVAGRFGHRHLSAAYKTARNQFAYLILEVAWCPCRLKLKCLVISAMQVEYMLCFLPSIDSPDCIIVWCIQEKGMCSIDRFPPSRSSVRLWLACIYMHSVHIYPSCGSTSLSITRHMLYVCHVAVTCWELPALCRWVYFIFKVPDLLRLARFQHSCTQFFTYYYE